MRLYKISVSEETDDGTPFMRQHYVGTKADGVAYRKQLVEEGFRRKDIEEVEVDVPTNKEGLIAFLNSL